jgi:SPP1 family predicted phage head-tail adaptor
VDVGRLRHRVRLQRQVDHEDSSGEVVRMWEDLDLSDSSTDGKVAAAIEPLSGREFVAAQQINSEASVRVTIRWRPGIESSMRVVHESYPGSPALTDIYDVLAALADPVINRRWITLLCARRTAEGYRSGL